jgi:hypothetical protein
MRWIEIIEVRSRRGCNDELEEMLNVLVQDINANNEACIRVYKCMRLETDFRINIYHDSDVVDINGSQLGLRIESLVRGLGMANHRIWIELCER